MSRPTLFVVEWSDGFYGAAIGIHATRKAAEYHRQHLYREYVGDLWWAEEDDPPSNPFFIREWPLGMTRKEAGLPNVYGGNR